MRDFRRLNVWRRSHRLALSLYDETLRWGRTGHPALASQARRAAMSVSTNISEGCGAKGPKEFARYLQVALASGAELEYHLLFAADARVMGRAQYEAMSRELEEIRKMLTVLRARVLASVPKE